VGVVVTKRGENGNIFGVAASGGVSERRRPDMKYLDFCRSVFTGKCGVRGAVAAAAPALMLVSMAATQ